MVAMPHSRYDGPWSRRCKPAVLFVLLLWFAVAADDVPAPLPLTQAHAHNDYRHARPLLDALEHGFCSVEADVFLVDGRLLVAHDIEDVNPDRTLKALYLDPLAARVKANGGRVYRDGPTFHLMIDIKSQAIPTYQAVHEELAGYEPMLSEVRDGKATQRAVAVVISGNRPPELIAGQQVRFAGIDGRLSDLASELPAHLMPWISDRWTTQFTWRGEGEMPAEERRKLRSLVEQAHSRGRKVRFWATPDQPAVWRELLDAKVDFINADDLAGLRNFLTRTDRP